MSDMMERGCEESVFDSINFERLVKQSKGIRSLLMGRLAQLLCCVVNYDFVLYYRSRCKVLAKKKCLAKGIELKHWPTTKFEFVDFLAALRDHKTREAYKIADHHSRAPYEITTISKYEKARLFGIMCASILNRLCSTQCQSSHSICMFFQIFESQLWTDQLLHTLRECFGS